MKEYFKSHNFNDEAAKLVGHCRIIVDRYQADGLKLTLRQLYYQLVVANIIPNQEKQYKRLSAVLSDARLMGFVDWSAIEDRIRVPKFPNQFDDLKDLAETAVRAYRLDRWAGQPYYVELWVEKDALSGVLEPVAHEYHIHLMVNRGYSSQTAMYDAGKRFLTACYGEKLPYTTLKEVLDYKENDKTGRAFANTKVLDRKSLGKLRKKPVLLYLGDHDPSGEDMVRDVADRLLMFGLKVDVRKVALTMEQVEEHDPPPNPAKTTDPRAQAYIDKHGDTSWEVDALPPDVLNRTIRDTLDDLVDWGKMNAVVEHEKRDKRALQKAVSKIKGKSKS